MLKAYKIDAGVLKQVSPDHIKEQIDNIAWIDLFNPKDAEEELVEDLLGINVPTREEMHEIEISSRFFKRDDTLFASLTKVTQSNTSKPEAHVITFVLHHKCLITIRYVDTHPFTTILTTSEFSKGRSIQGNSIFLWMLDKISDQLADILENVAREIEKLIPETFSSQTGESKQLDFKKMITFIGIQENLLSKSQESLFNLTRLLSFIIDSPYFQSAEERKAIQVIMRDLPPLIKHATFLSDKLKFLLDATLGMINIEQNAIIKIVSVAAVVFLPPTLVASVYGMNFAKMPELSWDFGYPFAMVLMLLAGFLPYTYFKYKKWL